MSAVSQPYGLMPINLEAGRVPLVAIPGGIASGYASNIGLFSPVTLATTGTLTATTTNSDFYGVFAGCEYYAAGFPLQRKGVNWTASSTYNAGTMIAYCYIAPDIQYKIQATGSIAQTAIGDEADFVNPGTVNTLGFSSAQINTTLAGAGAQGQLRILDKFFGVTNDWGDAFTDLVVEIARNQRRSNKVAV